MSDISLILLPTLISFTVVFFAGKKLGDGLSSALSVTSVLLSFALTVYFFVIMRGAAEQKLTASLYDWLSVAGINISAAFVFDRLSALFCLIITGIGSLIYIYSLGYMKEEKNTFRFFAYLNLFIFFMLVLVLGENLLVVFLGWEGVGLMSYLLIGYYGDKKSAGIASQKAFVMNRIGDFGFLMAMFTAVYLFSSLSFAGINQGIGEMVSAGKISAFELNLFLLFVFLACTGKSAQIPLYTWILDAMEAPTPVSALIHAATMVTSGLYLIARLQPAFILSPEVMQTVLYVGLATALIAAFIATAQNDIKRILAFSTVSQLGYMFVAMGAGAFEAGLFHLMTHAFFKALLFLGAGSVIYSLHHEQDIRKMGGLAEVLPKTSLCFMTATYSIAGLPLSAGFFSKDEILANAFFSPYSSVFVWTIGILTAGLTAYYMWRLHFKVFYHKPLTSSAKEHIAEAPPVMILPLYIFALFSAFIGFINIPQFLYPSGGGGMFHHYFAGFFSGLPPAEHGEAYQWLLMGITIVSSFIGVFAAFYLFNSGKTGSDKKPSSGPIIKLAENKLYVDSIYQAFIIRPIQYTGDVVCRSTGEYLVKFLSEFPRDFIGYVSEKYLSVQSGLLSLYTLMMFIGIMITMYILL